MYKFGCGMVNGVNIYKKVMLECAKLIRFAYISVNQ